MKNLALDARKLKLAIIEAIRDDPDFRAELRQLVIKDAIAIPVEPMYHVKVAAALVPMSYGALMNYINVSYPELFVRRYKRDVNGSRLRMISASEVRLLRDRLVIRGTLREVRKPRGDLMSVRDKERKRSLLAVKDGH